MEYVTELVRAVTVNGSW